MILEATILADNVNAGSKETEIIDKMLEAEISSQQEEIYQA